MYGQSNNYYQQPQQMINYHQPTYRAAMPDYMQYQTQFPQLKGRPVSSIDEVRAAQIDFDGSLFTFPDIANKRIYTKQISANGSAILGTYVLQEDAQPEIPNYVTREEFNTIVNQLQETIAKLSAVPAPVPAPAQDNQVKKEVPILNF